MITERPAHHYGPTLDELVDEASCKSQSGWDWTGPPSQVAAARNLAAHDSPHRGVSVPRRVGTGSSRIGIVTDRYITIRAVAEGVDPSAAIADIASRDLVMVDPTRLCREGVSQCSGA